jgi:hypothetical protein
VLFGTVVCAGTGRNRLRIPSCYHTEIKEGARTGEWGGVSHIDTVYTLKIPAGTKVYPGPVANQGGVYVGGGHQIFIPKPWDIDGVEVLGSELLP